MVAENYVDFPPHQLFKLPCRFLIQRLDKTFAAVEDRAGVVNKNYAITLLTADFNGDGYPDFIYVNLDGKTKAFINNGGKNHFIAVRFPENSDYIGSKVTVTLDDQRILSEVYVVGEGLGSDQTATLTFGLGNEKTIKNIKIKFPSGKEKILEKPIIDQVNLITYE